MKAWSAVGLFLVFFLSRPVIAQNSLVFSGIEGSANTEISLRVLKEAYKKIGIDVTYLPLPGERALRSSNAGQVDGEVFRIANVEKRYKNLVVVPTAINVLQGIAFTKNKDFPIKGWESLKPYKIGIQVGIKFAERGTQGMQRIMVDTNEQLFKMLHSERVDVIVVAYANGLQALNRLKLSGIRSLHPAIQEYPLYHYLHKRHQSLVPKLNTVFREMQKMGRFEAIRKSVIDELQRDLH